MQTTRSRFGSGLFITTILFTASLVTPAAMKEQVIYAARGDQDGAFPVGPVIMDSSGNIYGTTRDGGGTDCNNGLGCGTVFELSFSGGNWTRTGLYSFQDNGQDGYGPYGSIAMDDTGNIYGATVSGGTGTCDGGCGTVFELSPQQGGTWTETILHSFQNDGQDGISPQGGVTLDASGNLYGTTLEGGPNSCFNIGCGTVFEISADGHGGWTESVLHGFQHAHGDGSSPNAGVTIDASGNLYGTTEVGGVEQCIPSDHLGCGVVFRLSPQTGGGWIESILYQFHGHDGNSPASGVILDAAGNLYGTTIWGGNRCSSPGCGVVYELHPRSQGQWLERLIHVFPVTSKDGRFPTSNLAFDTSGNLFGTAQEGGQGSGCSGGCGIAFELSPRSGGGWTGKTIHNFQGNGVDGINPLFGLTIDPFGNLYGTTPSGGLAGFGTVYEIMP